MSTYDPGPACWEGRSRAEPGARLVSQAQAFVGAALGPGDWALDATLGQGRDTLFLARCVGATGCVYGFDIQPRALEATRQRLAGAGALAQTRLILADHARLGQELPAPCRGRLKGAMMNLGYLPGGDRSLRTRTETTLAALHAMPGLLAPGGRLSVLAYTGHPGGAEEAEAVHTWACSLASLRYAVVLPPPMPGRRRQPLLACIGKPAG